MEKTVLILDDDENFVQLLGSFLQMSNFKVKPTTSAKIALKLLEKNTPSIIITDYHMPQMKGSSFITQARQIERCKDIPCILLSGTDEVDELPENIVLLMKPISTADIVTRIEEILSQLSKSSNKISTFPFSIT